MKEDKQTKLVVLVIIFVTIQVYHQIYLKKLNLSKMVLKLLINKIDWQNNKNPELVKKYQTVVDSYVEKLDNEYLNIKKQFDDIVDNDVKHEIDNVSLID